MNSLLRTYTSKTIIVIGGTSGMGKAVVQRLAPVAKTIICIGRDRKAGAALVRSLPENGVFEAVEMRNADEVRETLQAVAKRYGPIDVCFNFAGTFLAGEMRDTPIEDWQSIFDTNIKPIIHGTSVMYQIMRKQGYGQLVNVASAAGLFPVPVMNIYGATKSAVVSLSQGLRAEANGFGVKVTVVCPTVVDTPLYDTALFDGVNKQKALRMVKAPTVQSADVAAERIIRGAARNRAIVHTSFVTRLVWWGYRISPPLYVWATSRFFLVYRQRLRKI
jgi:NADP-dependent 3-hydroxy acid dehydrogenase YdfG